MYEASILFCAIDNGRLKRLLKWLVNLACGTNPEPIPTKGASVEAGVGFNGLLCHDQCLDRPKMEKHNELVG